MKTNRVIKIFLASSEELEADRYRFGNLIRKLDNIYEKRGIRIELFEWEDYDAAYNGMRKQDEYNERVRASDMFLALFHKKAGKFTIEEFNIARKAFDEQASPKIYTYIKDLEAGESESRELAEFKRLRARRAGALLVSIQQLRHHATAFCPTIANGRGHHPDKGGGKRVAGENRRQYDRRLEQCAFYLGECHAQRTAITEGTTR